MYEKIIIEKELKKKRSIHLKKVENFEQVFEEKYGKYKELVPILGGYYIYAIPRNKENMAEVFKLLKSVEKYFDFFIRTENFYDIEDYKAAIGFMLRFPYGCDEYDNFHDRDELEISFFPCESCIGQEKKEIFYLSVEPHKSKKMKTEYMGISTEYGDYIISIPMYEFLIENGIDENAFRAVYNLRNKIIGYRIYGEQNILPSFSVIVPHGWVDSQCDTCGRTYIRETLFSEETDLDEVIEYLNEPSNGHIMNKAGLGCLKDTNLTAEYYPVYQEVIISRKMYDLMSLKWKEIKNYVVPLIYNDEVKGYF